MMKMGMMMIKGKAGRWNEAFRNLVHSIHRMLPFQTGNINHESGRKRPETKPWGVPPRSDKSTLGPCPKKTKFVFVTIQLFFRCIQVLEETRSR